MGALSLCPLPPQAAAARAAAARLNVTFNGAGAASGTAPAVCTSTLVIVSTRFPLTAGGAILLGCGAQRARSAAHEPAIRETSHSNNS
jgi:hypothetical protein